MIKNYIMISLLLLSANQCANAMAREEMNRLVAQSWTPESEGYTYLDTQAVSQLLAMQDKAGNYDTHQDGYAELGRIFQNNEQTCSNFVTDGRLHHVVRVYARSVLAMTQKELCQISHSDMTSMPYALNAPENLIIALVMARQSGVKWQTKQEAMIKKALNFESEKINGHFGARPYTDKEVEEAAIKLQANPRSEYMLPNHQ